MTYNFVYDVFVFCVYIICVGSVFRLPVLEGRIMLVPSLCYVDSVNTEGDFCSVFLISDGRRLDRDDDKRDRLFSCQLMWQTAVIVLSYDVLQIDEFTFLYMRTCRKFSSKLVFFRHYAFAKAVLDFVRTVEKSGAHFLRRKRLCLCWRYGGWAWHARCYRRLLHQDKTGWGCLCSQMRISIVRIC